MQTFSFIYQNVTVFWKIAVFAYICADTKIMFGYDFGARLNTTKNTKENRISSGP